MKEVREMREIEREDAPSGYVRLYNYKEPFMEYKEGYGFQGVLLYDGDSGKVQCHMCGEWFHTLGNHLRKEHSMLACMYKEAVGLRQSTALISEEHRELLIANSNASSYPLKARIANLTRHKKGSKLAKEIAQKSAKTRSEQAKRREFQNVRGTCPAQLLDRIEAIVKEKGENFTQTDVTRHLYGRSLISTFGSVRNAIALAGFKARENSRYISKDMALELMRTFYYTHNRMPTTSDTKRGLLPTWKVYARHFGSFKNAKRELSKIVGENA